MMLLGSQPNCKWLLTRSYTAKLPSARASDVVYHRRRCIWATIWSIAKEIYQPDQMLCLYFFLFTHFLSRSVRLFIWRTQFRSRNNSRIGNRTWFFFFNNPTEFYLIAQEKNIHPNLVFFTTYNKKISAFNVDTK